MPRSGPQLAKLTRPRLHGAVSRERLFKLLDEARETCPAIYVVGPPGAGKTTLVASWLDARKLPGIWYQVDSGDADLPTFFHYLGQAAAPFARKGQRPLPALTPEYLQDIPGFTRRFLRELFSRLPSPSVLVLDNYQEVPPESAFHEAVSLAVEEVPKGLNLIAVSRADPPTHYARFIANETVVLLEWDDLKLTVEETRAIARVRTDLPEIQIGRLHEKSGGWVAGLTLLTERLRRGGSIEQIDAPESLQDVFSYFAGQLFDRAPEDRRVILMQLSYLPSVTEQQAERLSGQPGAGRLLEELWRRHLFVDRRKGAAPAYVFHALFRAFLQHRAGNALTVYQRADMAQRAARLLDASGQTEEAMALYLLAGDTPATEALVLREAARLIGQGRWKVVVDWIRSLPEQRIGDSCWLMHWLGTARIAVDPLLAREALERSYDLAVADRDDLCQIQAAAGIVQTYILQYTHFRPLDRWIDVLLLKLSERIDFPNLETELGAQSALLIALAYRRPGHPRIAACVERVFELVQTGAEANLRLVAATSLFAYGTTIGPVHLARRALPILHALLRHPEVTALNAAWSWFIISYLHCICREFSLCREAISSVERLGRDHGLPAVFKFAAIIGAWAALFEQDVIGARKGLEWMEQTTSPSDLYDVATCHVTKGFWLLLSGDPDAMVRHYEQALPLFDEAGSIMHRSMYRIILSFALTQTGAFEEARRRIAQAWEIAGPSIPGWQAGALYASDASLALKEGDEARAVQALAAMLSTSREHGEARGFVNWFGRWMPSLCAEAMARGIEAEHVRYLIRRYGWQPPTPAPEQWPWRVKAYTLGRFELLLDDQPLAFLHKTPRKPLALLKALIAMGGAEVTEHKLIDALWPGDEGDTARKAYNITLHRLRGLLGDHAALLVEGGRVSLNAQLCWLDVWEVERAFGSASERLRHGDQSGFVSEGERAAALYRGGFLPSDTDLDWTVSLRERLRGRFIQLVEGVGKRLEASAAWEQAIDWYLRGLQADDLTESFYQGLMRCYQQTGRRAEALSVFRRMRQTLSVTLGIAPSGQSEALYQDLLTG